MTHVPKGFGWLSPSSSLASSLLKRFKSPASLCSPALPVLWLPGIVHACARSPRTTFASVPSCVSLFGGDFNRPHYHFRHEVILILKHPYSVTIVTGFN